jgi:hypothetical protein
MFSNALTATLLVRNTWGFNMFNQGDDLQRTPIYSRKRDIPIPEKDILDPVAEYNKGELYAMEIIEDQGWPAARNVETSLLETYEEHPDFTQGYCDALEFEATREQ